MDKIKSSAFYQAWIDTVMNRKDHLLSIWRDSAPFTRHIKGDDNCVLEEVASRLGLLCYPYDYYSLDAILYKAEDKTPDISSTNYWFRDIRVAFEHENKYNKELYQEVSHLLITNCDLKVLVTYPPDNFENILDYLHKIISGNRQSVSISEEESFLLILGWEGNFSWEGYVFKNDNWKQINV
ncbi:MAG TPA: hypothetical protein DIW47_11990 [Bacteroidetes bacterium]|nr:hypothetical protein [Bacteroidota bacterium]